MNASAPLPEFTPVEEERIRRRVRERGLTFEVFLPEGLADWLRTKLADGTFDSPQEAAFVAFTDLRDLDEHPEARRALLKACISTAWNEEGPSLSAEEVFGRLRKRMQDLAKED